MSHSTPGGAQTRSKQHGVYGGAPYPQYSEWSRGSLTHENGRTYIDWQAALASVGLGYGAVDEAIIKMITDVGITHPLPTRLEGEVAEQLMGAIGFGEQVRWVKTGSEATAAAMMIARRATGRKRIVSLGYSGWHETHQPGPNRVCLPIDSTLWSKHIDGDTAAALVESTRDIVGDGNHIRNIQKRCRDVGALLILDEMVMGFRLAIGGASEYFRITPDLATYGKAMANGAALACVVGLRKLMKHALDVSSTFGGEGVGLAAAKATIEVYQRDNVIERLWEVGRKLQEGVPQLQGWPVHPHFTGAGGWTDSESVIPLTQYAAQHGVLMHPSGMNPMFAHTDEQVQRTIEVLQQAIHTLAK